MGALCHDEGNIREDVPEIRNAAFMAILAFAVEERVDAKTGALLLRPLVALGVFQKRSSIAAPTDAP
jgi:hypothetical protein